MERRFIPGNYAREFNAQNEAMRRGDIPPQVEFYDPLIAEDQTKLRKDLKAATGSKIIPWSVFQQKALERAEKKADKKGVYRDEFELYTRDKLKLDNGETFPEDKPQEYEEAVKDFDKPENYLIVRYPWLNAFVKIPRQEEFNRIAQSRETGITSEAAQEEIKKEKFLIIGGGVGGRIGVSLANAGAGSVTIVDGAQINPHRISRANGPIVPSMGENQATYYVKQMLEINPFGDYRAIPKYIGDAAKDPNLADLDMLLDQSTFVFQEIDQLAIKGDIHKKAQQKHIRCAQLTDAGRNIIVMYDDPNFVQPPFNGRLTDTVYQQMQALNPEDRIQFLAKAVEVYMGHDNITLDFAAAIEYSKEKGFTHIPQSGRAAGKVGSEAVNLFCDIVDGRITGPVEKLVA